VTLWKSLAAVVVLTLVGTALGLGAAVLTQECYAVAAACFRRPDGTLECPSGYCVTDYVGPGLAVGALAGLCTGLAVAGVLGRVTAGRHDRHGPAGSSS